MAVAISLHSICIAVANLLTRYLDPRIAPLLLVNFIGALGYSVILPFLVFLVQDFGGSAILYALIASIYPAFQMVGAPLLGRWSDRIGRKRVLLISQVGTFVSWGIFLIAFALPVRELFQIESGTFGLLVITLPLTILMLARMVDGLTGGNISVANAYLADITSPEERKANYGKLAAAMNVGFIIGPTLSGLLTSLPNGKMWTVVVAAAISFVGIFIILWMLPDVQPCDDHDPDHREHLKKALNAEHTDCHEDTSDSDTPRPRIWSVPYLGFFLVLYFLIFLVFNFFYATFPIHAADNIGWSASALGFFFTLLSAVMIFTQSVLLPRLAERFSDVALFVVGCMILIVSFGSMAMPITWLVYVAAVCYGLGNGLMWPSFLSLLSTLGNARQQGEIQGVAGSAGSLASIFGLIAGGFIFNLVGADIFWLSAVGIGVIGLLGLRLRGAGEDS